MFFFRFVFPGTLVWQSSTSSACDSASCGFKCVNQPHQDWDLGKPLFFVGELSREWLWFGSASACCSSKAVFGGLMSSSRNMMFSACIYTHTLHECTMIKWFILFYLFRFHFFLQLILEINQKMVIKHVNTKLFVNPLLKPIQCFIYF